MLYYSATDSKITSKPRSKAKSPRKTWKGTLAGDTFQALHLYLDVFNCGEWYQDAPHFSITNEQKRQYADRYNSSDPKRVAMLYHAGRLNAKRIQRGIERDDQYFTCNKSSASSLSLVYLDLDDHHPHQTDKAQLTQAVLNFVGPDNLFFNEGRLWVKGCWKDSDYPKFKQAYTAFTEALKSWAVAKGFQTNVDSPKGFNQLGRLPLKNWNYTKLGTFKNTAHVTVEMLKGWSRRLKEVTKRGTSPSTFCVIDSHVDRGTDALVESPSPSTVEDCYGDDTLDDGDAPLRSASRPTPPLRSVAGKVTPEIKGRSKVNLCKSLSGMPLTEEEIEDIPDRIKRYRSLSYRCMDASRRHRPKGQRLYSLDVQYALTLLDFQFRHANENHGAPVKRAEAWWNWMVEEGYFTRGWCGKKWAAIHRMLVDCGVLNVIDQSYWFHDDGGKPGKAMLYHIKEEYLAVATKGGEASIEEVKIDFLPNRTRPCLVLPPERQFDFWASPQQRQKLDEILYEAAA